jgi:transposase
MIAIPSGVRVWLATGHTDMRKGFDGLALLVQEKLQRDPHGGHLFVLVKILWHDGLGMSLYAKRLERGRFIWPAASFPAPERRGHPFLYEKSTSRVATSMRTAPDGMITPAPSRCAAPPAASRHGASRHTHRHYTNRDLDSRRPAPGRHSRLLRQGVCPYQDRRKRHAALRRPPAGIAAPAEQLLRRQTVPARHGAHRLATRIALGDDPPLLLRRPTAPSARAREYVHPADRLRFGQKLSVRHVSNRSSEAGGQTVAR